MESARYVDPSLCIFPSEREVDVMLSQRIAPVPSSLIPVRRRIKKALLIEKEPRLDLSHRPIRFIWFDESGFEE